jgi:predicted nucleic acid-binding protein
MTARTFIDTNVLVYAYDPVDQRKQEIAARELLARADGIVLSAQILSEFYTVVTRRLATPMSTASAAAAVDQLRRYPIVPVDEHLVMEGIGVSVKSQISYWDGLIIAAACASGCEALMTEDLRSGATIAGVRIENPFE